MNSLGIGLNIQWTPQNNILRPRIQAQVHVAKLAPAGAWAWVRFIFSLLLESEYLGDSGGGE